MGIRVGLPGKRIVSRLRRFGMETTGAALVETTLLMPFLLMLSAGVFEFGNLLYQRLLLEGGVRDAARYAARCPQVAGVTFDCSDAKAKNVAVYGDPDGGATPRVRDWSTSLVTIARPETANNFDPVDGTYDYRGGPTITTIHVETSFTYTGTGLLPYIGFDNIVLNAVHEERYIGW
jgi:hypothetical protein